MEMKNYSINFEIEGEEAKQLKKALNKQRAEYEEFCIQEYALSIHEHIKKGFLTIDTVECSFAPNLEEESKQYFTELFEIAKERVRKELEDGGE